MLTPHGIFFDIDVVIIVAGDVTTLSRLFGSHMWMGVLCATSHCRVKILFFHVTEI